MGFDWANTPHDESFAAPPALPRAFHLTGIYGTAMGAVALAMF